MKNCPICNVELYDELVGTALEDYAFNGFCNNLTSKGLDNFTAKFKGKRLLIGPGHDDNGETCESDDHFYVRNY